jgi:hypothetical protein
MIMRNGSMCAAQPTLEPTAPSALVVSRLFGFVGKLVQGSGCANPALRLSFSVGRASGGKAWRSAGRSVAARWV